MFCLFSIVFTGRTKGQLNWMRSSSLAPSIDLSSNDQIGAIAQWMRLCLPFCGPWFESQARHLCFFNLYLNCDVKRTKINKKKPGLGQFLKTSKLVGQDTSYRSHPLCPNQCDQIWRIFIISSFWQDSKSLLGFISYLEK